MARAGTSDMVAGWIEKVMFGMEEWGWEAGGDGGEGVEGGERNQG